MYTFTYRILITISNFNRFKFEKNTSSMASGY